MRREEQHILPRCVNINVQWEKYVCNNKVVVTVDKNNNNNVLVIHNNAGEEASYSASPLHYKANYLFTIWVGKSVCQNVVALPSRARTHCKSGPLPGMMGFFDPESNKVGTFF